RFADQLTEELNLKKVTAHDGAAGALLRYEIKPNMKTLGPKFGPRLKDAQAAIAAADAALVAAKVQAGEAFDLDAPGGGVTLAPEDVVVTLRAPEGWAGASADGIQAMLDVRITEELARE